MNLKLSIFSTVALLLSVALLNGCGGDTASQQESSVARHAASDTSLQDVRARGYLRLSVYADRPPFSYIDNNNEFQGYDVELGKRLAKELFGDETKVRWVPTPAANRAKVLQNDEADIVVANYTKTPERARLVDFGLPYMKTAFAMVTRKERGMRFTENLIVVRGTTAAAYFKKNQPDVKLLVSDSVEGAFNALREGRGNALAEDNTTLYTFVNNDPEFEVFVDRIGPEEVIAPAVKQGNRSLLEWTNKTIRQLYQEGFFYKAYDVAVKPHYGNGINPDNIVVGKELSPKENTTKKEIS